LSGVLFRLLSIYDRVGVARGGQGPWRDGKYSAAEGCDLGA
jgi:hypothetical protein